VDAGTCQVRLTVTTSVNGLSAGPAKTPISFRRVEKLEVGTEEDAQNRVSALNGLKSSITPAVYRITLKFQSGDQVIVRMRDEETANRMAKAMNHAAELCGGGSKGPF
jgi:hypothetical protein